jgi:hypothetical protein
MSRATFDLPPGLGLTLRWNGRPMVRATGALISAPPGMAAMVGLMRATCKWQLLAGAGGALVGQMGRTVNSTHTRARESDTEALPHPPHWCNHGTVGHMGQAIYLPHARREAYDGLLQSAGSGRRTAMPR